MMNKTQTALPKMIHAGILTLALLAAGLLILWCPRPVEGQLEGYAEVNRLEVGYVPGTQSLQARISLATGPSLNYEATSEKDFDALFRMAQVFGQRGTRMFVVVKDDKIKSFQISIP
jgi:hypothetical protein